MNLSEMTKAKIKKLIFPVILLFATVVLAVWLYARLSALPSYEVYAVGGRYIPSGETFSETDLIRVDVQFGDSSLLQSVVPVPPEGLQGIFTATADLNPGKFLSPGDYQEGYVAPQVSAEIDLPENLMVTTLSLTAKPQTQDQRIVTASGVFHLVTDTYPPKHIACVYEPESGGLMVAAEDYTYVKAWLELGTVTALKHTADTCPIGGTPLRCGILTSASNPLATTTVPQPNPETGEVPAGTETVPLETLIPECASATADDLVEASRRKEATGEDAGFEEKIGKLLNLDSEDSSSVEIPAITASASTTSQPPGDLDTASETLSEVDVFSDLAAEEQPTLLEDETS